MHERAIASMEGAGHVVYPERDTGKRVAHLIGGRLMDYIEFDDGFAIVKMAAAAWDAEEIRFYLDDDLIKVVPQSITYPIS